ncbi:MAG TPA: hypothetical protein VK943_11260, partial [Arenibaculum sp.]|nr:hypothetical protein [Arenibaculum sp.]
RRGVDWARTYLVKGWFDDTLTPELIRTHGIERASVIMVDCVIYSSTRTVLRFCEPLIKGSAIIVFDDWNAYGLADDGMGERRAFEEFLADHPDIEVVGQLPTYDRLAAVFLVHRPAR